MFNETLPRIIQEKLYCYFKKIYIKLQLFLSNSIVNRSFCSISFSLAYRKNRNAESQAGPRTLDPRARPRTPKPWSVPRMPNPRAEPKISNPNAGHTTNHSIHWSIVKLSLSIQVCFQ